MQPSSRIAAVIGLLAGLPAAQKPAEAGAKSQRVVTPVGEVRVLGDKEAAALVSRIKQRVLARSAKRDKKKRGGGKLPSFLQRLDEVEALSRVQHAKLVPVLKKVLLNDPNDAVRVKAAEALGAQPKRQSVRVAEQLIKDRKFQKRGALAAPIIKLLSFHGGSKSTWKMLRKRFLELGGLGQQAFLVHVGARKDWDSVDLLLDNIDPPAPANVDDPNNPPASYWKARWEQWRSFKPALREACEQLFGRSFATRRAATEYIEAQGGLEAIRKKRG